MRELASKFFGGDCPLKPTKFCDRSLARKVRRFVYCPQLAHELNSAADTFFQSLTSRGEIDEAEVADLKRARDKCDVYIDRKASDDALPSEERVEKQMIPISWFLSESVHYLDSRCSDVRRDRPREVRTVHEYEGLE